MTASPHPSEVVEAQAYEIVHNQPAPHKDAPGQLSIPSAVTTPHSQSSHILLSSKSQIFWKTAYNHTNLKNLQSSIAFPWSEEPSVRYGNLGVYHLHVKTMT